VSVVVLLLSNEGNFISSGRAMMDSLAPGAETPFLIALPAAAGTGRYRITVQTEDRVIPHIDRRSAS
jgi:hypothetical protein